MHKTVMNVCTKLPAPTLWKAKSHQSFCTQVRRLNGLQEALGEQQKHYAVITNTGWMPKLEFKPQKKVLPDHAHSRASEYGIQPDWIYITSYKRLILELSQRRQRYRVSAITVLKVKGLFL